MGLTFKENCADIRNSGVKNIIDKLRKYNCHLDLYDPWAESIETKKLYGLKKKLKLIPNKYDAIIISVAHDKFKKLEKTKLLIYVKKIMLFTI